MNSNIFTITGEIDMYHVEMLQEMVQYGALDSNKPLEVIVSSPGGSLTAAVCLYETMKHMFSDITTFAYGSVYSAAIIPFMAAPVEKRYSSPGATFLIHKPVFNGVSGNANVLTEAAEQLNVHEESIILIYERNLSLNRDEISAIINEEKLIVVEDAIKIGLVGSVKDDVKNMASVFINKPINRAENTMAAEIVAKNKAQDGSAKRDTDVSLAELERVRSLTQLLGKGCDDVVLNEIKKEGGLSAKDVAMNILLSGDLSKPRIVSAENVEPGNVLSPQKQKEWENFVSATWTRPSVGNHVQATLSQVEADTPENDFQENPKLSAAFGTVENYRKFLKTQGIAV